MQKAHRSKGAVGFFVSRNGGWVLRGSGDP